MTIVHFDIYRFFVRTVIFDDLVSTVDPDGSDVDQRMKTILEPGWRPGGREAIFRWPSE